MATAYIFIQRLNPIGGIETLILRILDQLVALGDPVIIFGTSIAKDTVLPTGAHFVPLVRDSDGVRVIARYVSDQLAGHDLVVISLHPWALASAYALRYRLSGKDVFRSFHLVTHSRAMFFSGPLLVKKLLRKIFTSAPRRSTYFMNEPARAAHAAEWGIDLGNYPVLRLPVGDAGGVTQTRPRGTRLRLVSIGRLVPFKGYNRGAAVIMRQLRDLGIDVEWVIWGDGEDAGHIQASIDREGGGDRIVLKGSLPYERFGNEVMQHDLFIGMGTAILEAALQGVPSICAIENGGSDCYGFFHEAPLDTVGDAVAGAPREAILECILRFTAMDEGERRAVGDACRAAAQARSATLEGFADAIRSASPWPRSGGIGSWAMAAAIWPLARLRDRTIVKKRS